MGGIRFMMVERGWEDLKGGLVGDVPGGYISQPGSSNRL